jgi:acyl-CoA thioesterase I
MAEISFASRFRRIPILLTFMLAIAASLLVFPSALLWMVAAWLVVGTWSALRGTNRWLPFAACAVVLVIKRPDWSSALLLLGIVMLAVAILFYRYDRKLTGVSKNRATTWVLVAVWIAWLAAVWQSYEGCHIRKSPLLHRLRPIVCVGDSLTTGLSAKEAYPEYLQQLVSVPVVNFGRPGVTAREMVEHLPEILAEQPQLVIIELGGHDFLRGYGRAATRASLVQIIEACQQAEAEVVLVEIPRGFITDPFSGLERELAREYDLRLIPDSAIRMLVVRSPAIPFVGELAKPHWSDDGLHPNAAGAQMLADAVYRALHRMYGTQVSRGRL